MFSFDDWMNWLVDDLVVVEVPASHLQSLMLLLLMLAATFPDSHYCTALVVSIDSIRSMLLRLNPIDNDQNWLLPNYVNCHGRHLIH